MYMYILIFLYLNAFANLNVVPFIRCPAVAGRAKLFS